MSLLSRFSGALLLSAVLVCASCTVQHQAEASAGPVGPPVSKFYKEVDGSVSPDKRFAVVAGYPKPGPADWKEEHTEEGDPYFDLVSGPQAPINLLVDRKKDHVLATLPTSHDGTLQKYNHEELSVAWSKKSSHLIVMQSWRWGTPEATLYRLDSDGRVSSELDLLPIATEQFRKAITRKSPRADASKYVVKLHEPNVTDQGEVTLKGETFVPKSVDDLDLDVTLKIRFKASVGKGTQITVSELKAEELEDDPDS